MEILKIKAFDLLIEDNFFVIPTFQIPYKWAGQQLSQFMETLLLINSKKMEEYFIGSLIVSERENKYFVLDGQQRLTTMFIYSIAYSDVMKENYPSEWINLKLEKLSNKIRFVNDEIKLSSLYEDKVFLNQLFRGQINTKGKNNKIKY